VRFEPATGRLFLCPDRPEATFSALCELVHIRLAESGASCNSPDGASRFQYPGLARSLTVYYVSGLVFFPRLFVPPFSLNQRCFCANRGRREIRCSSRRPMPSSQAGDLPARPMGC
jgi:hypothetical protein